MIRRFNRALPKVLAVAFVAVLLAGCAVPKKSTPGVVGPAETVTPIPLYTGRTLPPSASISPNPSASDPLGLPHADLNLESSLPTIVGGVTLTKFSLSLSAYIASTTGAGENALYGPWLVKFGSTPSQVVIAVASDLRQDGINMIIHAIHVPGATASALSSGFADVATKAGWPVRSVTVVKDKATLEVVDPAAKAAGTLSAGYVYSKGDVLYTVITDNPSLLVEAIVNLP
ncbi:MAG TPA: hypothetical protein VF337_04720 [Candidatus Limnocylindrales bacterium]